MAIRTHLETGVSKRFKDARMSGRSAIPPRVGSSHVTMGGAERPGLKCTMTVSTLNQ